MMCSVLGHILPEAMVCYLENYSSEKFAEIFLGEFDTPEAIWSAEMRCECYISVTICGHISAFALHIPAYILSILHVWYFKFLSR